MKIGWSMMPFLESGARRQPDEKATYLVLSMLGSLEVEDFSQITGMRSGYFSLILSASALRASKRTSGQSANEIAYRSRDDPSCSSFV